MPTPLILQSAGELFDADTPVASDIEVVPLHIVAHAAPVPTLFDGRPS